ncbi:MAG: hypothetical protein K2L90_01265 [Muribaculaceae bacterium]|nr:hypothetical protein [Muribaculaceae bacterium]
MNLKSRSPYLAVDRFARMGLVWQLLGVIVAIVVLMAAVAFVGGIFDPYDWFLIGANPGDPGTTGGRVASILLYALFSIGFTGLFITYIINWMDRRRDRWECGAARYNITDDFALIIGGHSMTPRLCASLLSDVSNRYVVVTTGGDADRLRRRIYSELPDALHDRLIVYHASQTSDLDLQDLNAYMANTVYILGDDGSTSDADNMETYRRLIALSRPVVDIREVSCHVLLGSISACRVLYASDVESRDNSPFDFLPLFVCDEWARRVIIGDSVKYPGMVAGSIDPESVKRVHVILLGITDMSLSVMCQAAQLLHFPNSVGGRTDTLTRITVVDGHMTERLPWIRNCYSQLFESLEWHAGDNRILQAFPMDGITDIEWTFIDADPDSGMASERIVEQIGSDDIVTIVISNPDGDSASVSTAFNLRPDIYVCANVIQVLVHQSGSSALIDEVAKGIIWTGDDGATHTTSSRFAKFKPFGMDAECDYVSDFNAVEPKVIAYAYQNLDTDPGLDRLLIKAMQGDFSELDNAWQSLSTHGGKSVMSQRMSNIYSAGSIPFKAGWLDPEQDFLTERQIELLAGIEHLRWNMEQLLSGYRPMSSDEAKDLATGKVSRADLKSRFIHPDIVPYSRLGEGSRNYDRAIVKCIPNFIKICKLYNES